MTKLTTERLGELANATTPSVKYVGREIIAMARQLLAYDQAAKNEVALPEALKYAEIYGRAFICVDRNGSVHAVDPSQITLTILNEPAPVLPKQPEPVVLYMGRELISKEGLELIKDGVSEATQLESMCMASAILGGGYPAQPVIPREWTIFNAVSFIAEYQPPSNEEAALFAWNACRDEMLKAQPVSEPYNLPSGWKLVPIEPTAAMFHAFNDCDYGRKSMRERYIQMIEAAPARESE